jgi:(E)-4-hydroxy-3-methylbut-2-enyl-diphosphate synthase
MAEKRDYPLHLGVTEAGTLFRGAIKSAVGIGSLLEEGIGDTIRVSLTANPVDEVIAGYEILKALNLREHGVEFVSCPMCGRCEIDLIGIAKEVENYVKKINKPLKVAVMGCVVNGPGEASDADIGLAGGKGMGFIFKKGKKYKRVTEEEMVDVFIEEIDRLIVK